jgi:hypothetical protein
VKVFAESQKNKTECTAKQKANAAQSNQPLKRDVHDRRKEKAKKGQQVKSQQFQLSSTTSVVPQKREWEADNQDKDNEGDWAEIAWEGRWQRSRKERSTGVQC